MTTPEERARRSQNFRRFWKLVAFALTVTAVVKELRTPPEERTWNGTIVGFVPYDLRFPTLERVKQRMWNPDAGFINPRVFGVGWTVNIGKLVTLVRERISS